MDSRVRSMLVWLIMAAFCGLIGFAIVYYYATNDRPIERFAIVIDAGSTQTRSSLFKISIEPERMLEVELDKNNSAAGATHRITRLSRTPLGELIRVQQVSSCVNGGPLAAITSEKGALELIRKCLIKFSEHIKLLDFIDVQNKLNKYEEEWDEQLQPAAGSEPMDADDVSKQMALINHRVNSITHLHLGATAGMRALAQVNASRAEEKLAWVNEAIGESNSLLSDNSPYINPGQVAILNGTDEASFGWLSVNFVCDTLAAYSLVADDDDAAAAAAANTLSEVPLPQSVSEGAHGQSSNVQYHTITNGSEAFNLAPVVPQLDEEPISVGTLELGGASAQMAFQVVNNLSGSRQIQNVSIDEQQLNLFNGHHKLATRSDLCLGMSQAVLRLNYVLLHKTMSLSSSNFQSPSLKLVNACMQKGAHLKFTGAELAKIWRGACLLANESEQTNPSNSTQAPAVAAAADAAAAVALVEREQTFRQLVTSKESVEFVGIGNVDQCDLLLNELIQPNLCKRYFSLCPSHGNNAPPPSNMPFVTLSGYNHAINALNIRPNADNNNNNNNEQDDALSDMEKRLTNTTNRLKQWKHLASTIDDKLGGNSISYNELLERTRQFCATNVSDIPLYYPRVNKQFQNIICLQLVYIRKLLTEFYLFDPLTNWNQIKFLVFQPKSVPEQYTNIEPTLDKAAQAGARGNDKSGTSGADGRPEIGWTLGLLLNATSQQLSSTNENEIYYHHGASVMYIVRATILMMLACFLIAIALLVVGIVEVRRAQERGCAYVGHPSSPSPRSSYDIRSLCEIENSQGDTPSTFVRVQQQEFS